MMGVESLNEIKVYTKKYAVWKKKILEEIGTCISYIQAFCPQGPRIKIFFTYSRLLVLLVMEYPLRIFFIGRRLI